ncbi:MAG: hypothetical protein ABSG86_19395 [Thermoguttaceae bacterium]|jgi:hypothetical protein
MPKLVTLNADYLLAMILAERQSFPFVALGKLQQEIESLCPIAVVDVSSPSIRRAVGYYPEIFEWRGSDIARRRGAERYLESRYLKDEFTSSVPEDVTQLVRQAINRSLAAI